MALKESQVVLMEHSEVKVQLLKLYLEGYLSILNNSSYVGEIHLYDLFCGEGLYRNGGKGSPIIILETIRSIQEQNLKSTVFHCHFNDLDKAKINKIEKFIRDEQFNSNKKINISLTSIDYRDLVPSLQNEFSKFQNKKAFIFIDPYGYKDIKICDLKMLLESNHSEVLLFLPTQFMFRFAKNGMPESLLEFITELIPEELWPNSSTGLEFIENLTEAFKTKFSPERFVDSFVITRDRNQYFCLFFFTSHILGFEKMLDAKWNIDEEEGRGWTNEPENSLFATLEKQPNITKFKMRLKEFLVGEGRYNHELYEFTIRSGFRTCHAVQTLKAMQDGGELILERTDGGSVRKSAYYINYKCYKEEPHKLRIRLK